MDQIEQIIMKINTSQEKEKRIQHLNAQKTSFLSVSPRNDNGVKNLPLKSMMKRVETFQNIDNNRMNKEKIVEDQGFTNIFADDTQSTKHFSKRENYMSSQNLRVSFKGKQIPGKNVRQSENIHQTDNKTPPNSLCDKKIVITKSASNLTKPNQQFLYIKSDNLPKEPEKDEDTQEIKQLLAKIQQAKAFNERIQSENIQLRLEKLYYNSQSREILSLKKEINQMKRKIEKIKAENMKTEDHYYDYYHTKRQPKKPVPTMPFYQKQRASQSLPRTSSNIVGQYPPPLVNSYQVAQNFYQPLSSPLAKSKIQQKPKLKKSANQGNEERVYMGQSTPYKIHEDKDANIIRIEIRK